MKYFSPLALSIFLVGCAITPEDKEAAHQRQLEKEARENFIAMKAQEHPGRPVVLHDEAATPRPPVSSPVVKRPSVTPARTKVVAVHTPHVAPAPHVAPTPRVAAAAYNPPAPKPRGRHRADDTVYYWQVGSARQRISPRQQAAELKYARALAKRPENLTPEERIWAHEHY